MDNALENLAIDKYTFEKIVDPSGETKLTDREWDRVRDAIDGEVANYLDSMLYDFVLSYKEGVFDVHD